MEKIFKKARIIISLPVILNLALAGYCYFTRTIPQFTGYLIGALLGLFFAVIWVVMAKKVTLSNIMVFFTMSLGLFFIKIVLFVIFAFAGLYLFHMDQIYFAFAFLLGSMLSLFIEVWFMMAANKLNIAAKKAAKNGENLQGRA